MEYITDIGDGLPFDIERPTGVSMFPLAKFLATVVPYYAVYPRLAHFPFTASRFVHIVSSTSKVAMLRHLHQLYALSYSLSAGIVTMAKWPSG